MGISFNEKNKVFHLSNKNISYIIKVLPNGQLGHLYFGKRVHEREDYSYINPQKHRPMIPVLKDSDTEISLSGTMQEYPVYGTTDYRNPAMEVRSENGSLLVDAKYVGHRIFAGKKSLSALPATYTESDDEATTLEIDIEDKLTGLFVTLSYTIFNDRNAIARSARYENKGKETLHITTAMSFSVDFPDCDYEFVHFSGAWSRERTPFVNPIDSGIVSVGSRRGISSSEHNPFVILKRKDCNENAGEAYGLSFVYSGNFQASVQVDAFNTTRLMMGIHPNGFDWKLEPKDSFQTPEAVCVYTKAGLNDLSLQYHRLYRTRLARGYWRDRPRPILLNNWEATYFDFNEEILLALVDKAKECGIELFVLDDGWFGNRRDDYRGLGDWYPNLDILPNGISGLSKKIHEKGMMFGLWIEPEMVNRDSDLFRAHPDYILQTPGRVPSEGRHQYVLDFSRKEVVDCIYEMIRRIIREGEIDYIKWDMNRVLTEVYSAVLPADRQGEVFHRYTLGVYDLYSRLICEFPKVLFESCSSGGSRFDAGMLYYAPQAWVSDDTDAIERAKIQHGSSYCYPISSFGAHVSAVPNHQLNRATPLSTRANIAMFGTFGYELDINKLSDDEITEIKAQVSFMKEHRKLLSFGDFFRIKSPFSADGVVSWITVNEDKSKAIALWGRILNVPNGPLVSVRFIGLDPDKEYRVSGYQGTYFGDELMEIGLPIIETTDDSGHVNTYDFMTRLFVMEAL